MTRAARTLPLALLLVGGCGMYGPLFLVEDMPPEVAETPEITETPPLIEDAPAVPVLPAPEDPEPREEDEPEDGS